MSNRASRVMGIVLLLASSVCIMLCLLKGILEGLHSVTRCVFCVGVLIGILVTPVGAIDYAMDDEDSQTIRKLMRCTEKYKELPLADIQNSYTVCPEKWELSRDSIQYFDGKAINSICLTDEDAEQYLTWYDQMQAEKEAQAKEALLLCLQKDAKKGR